jgi:predicted house-cleaning noncanonical NTP pyrophosphatase (MazG superfamily)
MALTPAPDGYPLKIIRDNTTDIIGDKGELLYGYISTDPETLRPWLLKKLAEEVMEYVLQPGVDALADIYAVLAGLAKLHGMHRWQLQDMLDDEKRGGFFEGRMMLGYHAEFDGRSNA